MTALENFLPSLRAGRAMEPLPWDWFEFSERTGSPARREERGERYCQAGKIEIDGQLVPFKFMRLATDRARPVLVMLHGMGLTIGTFRGVSGYLFQSHDLLMPDYSGLSLSTAALPLDASLKSMSAAVWRLADMLNIEKISLAGNSLGGGLCLTTTLDAPQRVERLLLSNPACFPQVLPHMYRLVRFPLMGELFMTIAHAEKLIAGVEYIGYVDKSRFDPALKRHYIASLSRRRARFRLMQIIRSLPHDQADITRAPHLAYLGRITQPVLLTWGLQDLLLVKGAGHRLAAALPNCTFEAFEDLAHMPHEELPERVGPRWARFLTA